MAIYNGSTKQQGFGLPIDQGKLSFRELVKWMREIIINLLYCEHELF